MNLTSGVQGPLIDRGLEIIRQRWRERVFVFSEPSEKQYSMNFQALSLSLTERLSVLCPATARTCMHAQNEKKRARCGDEKATRLLALALDNKCN